MKTINTHRFMSSIEKDLLSFISNYTPTYEGLSCCDNNVDLVAVEIEITKK